MGIKNHKYKNIYKSQTRMEKIGGGMENLLSSRVNKLGDLTNSLKGWDKTVLSFPKKPEVSKDSLKQNCMAWSGSILAGNKP